MTMMDFIVECEECESTSIVGSYEKVKFCPVCGRRAEVEKTSTEVDAWINEDE